MRRVWWLLLLLLLTPLAAAADTDGDGWQDPSEDFGVWDGADAYPQNPDIHDPVFSTGCDPPVATLDLGEPVTFTCTVANEGPVAVRVMIDVEDDTHLRNRFVADHFDIGPSEVLELSVTMEGLQTGVATAHLRIFGRADESAHHIVDLPVEVTAETWPGLNSHSEGTPAPDVSFISRGLDDLAAWLSANTPLTVDRGQAGVVVLLTLGLLVGIARTRRARRIWRRNMIDRSARAAGREARFDALRRGGNHPHHEEVGIPDSPQAKVVDETDYVPPRLRR